jgi:hypothetical protein
MLFEDLPRMSQYPAAATDVANDRRLRVTSVVGRAIAGLAAVAALWTGGQFWLARERDSVDGLWLPAIIVYAAGLAYLSVTAATTWQTPARRGGRSSRLSIGSLLLWVAHALVLASAIIVAWRGVASRGVLVGVGGALIAWGVIAVLAGLFELATLFVRGRLISSDLSARDFDEPTVVPTALKLATACLAAAVALGLGVAYLETRPLPNLQPLPTMDAAQEPSAAPTTGAKAGVVQREPPTGNGHEASSPGDREG